jgi:hypothetical protein
MPHSSSPVVTLSRPAVRLAAFVIALLVVPAIAADAMPPASAYGSIAHMATGPVTLAIGSGIDGSIFCATSQPPQFLATVGGSRLPR